MMIETVEEIKSKLSALSFGERAALAHFLIHSLDEETDPEREAAWDVELAKRAQEIQSGIAVGEPADKVFSDLLKKHRS
jgi:putative addiction module component (TIGR02574 family)